MFYFFCLWRLIKIQITWLLYATQKDNSKSLLLVNNVTRFCLFDSRVGRTIKKICTNQKFGSRNLKKNKWMVCTLYFIRLWQFIILHINLQGISSRYIKVSFESSCKIESVERTCSLEVYELIFNIYCDTALNIKLI